MQLIYLSHLHEGAFVKLHLYSHHTTYVIQLET